MSRVVVASVCEPGRYALTVTVYRPLRKPLIEQDVFVEVQVRPPTLTTNLVAFVPIGTVVHRIVVPDFVRFIEMSFAGHKVFAGGSGMFTVMS